MRLISLSHINKLLGMKMLLKSSSTSRWTLGLAMAVVSFFPGLTQSSHADDDEVLTIGSPAPALDIEHWMSDRNGEMPKVTSFESDKVYVIEFWATWCGPCIRQMPHIAKLQDQYADQDVQIISVSREDLDTVNKFLVRKAGRNTETTYAEITNNYCLTTDPDESVNNDYMIAALRTGIPQAFIVGKTGLIEWIGHPSRMEGPLKSVLADDWDRAAFKEEFLPAQLENKKPFKVIQLMKQKKPAEALLVVQEIAAEEEEEAGAVSAQTSRMLWAVEMSIGGETALKAMQRAAEKAEGNPMGLNRLTTGIIRKLDHGDEVEPAMLEATLEVATEAVEQARTLENSDRMISLLLSNQAKLLSKSGKLDEAIASQEEAIELVSSSRGKKFLAELMAAKEGKPVEEEAEADAEAEKEESSESK